MKKTNDQRSMTFPLLSEVITQRNAEQRTMKEIRTPKHNDTAIHRVSL